jgi:hypothetical protein
MSSPLPRARCDCDHPECSGDHPNPNPRCTRVASRRFVVRWEGSTLRLCGKCRAQYDGQSGYAFEHVGAPWVPQLVVVLLAQATLLGCFAKASWIPNDHGGYTLMTRAGSMDQALTRFRRTAEDLCGDSPYKLSQPTVADRGWSFGVGGGSGFGGSTITAHADLSCK